MWILLGTLIVVYKQAAQQEWIHNSEESQKLDPCHCTSIKAMESCQNSDKPRIMNPWGQMYHHTLSLREISKQQGIQQTT